MGSDRRNEYVDGEMTHSAFHVERLKAPSRETFDPESYRRWHTMGVLWEGRQARYCIPLSLGEGSEEGALRVPILAGVSGPGCYVQTRCWERVTIYSDKRVDVTRFYEEPEGNPPEPDMASGQIEVYDRIVWNTVQKDCHHPALGKVVVVIEPSIAWKLTGDDDESPKMTLCWEEDTSPLGGYDPGSRKAIIEQLKEDIEEAQTDAKELRAQADIAEKAGDIEIAKSHRNRAGGLDVFCEEQAHFLHELEGKERRESAGAT